MANFNKVILIGNLTRDPELRVTQAGNSICKLGLAVNRTFRDKDGNNREETTFVDVDAFGKPAEIVSKYMAKGRALLVEGRLQLDQWESQNGEKRSKLKVVLENFQFLGGRGGDGEGGSGGYDQSATSRDSYQENSPPARKQSNKAASASGDSDIEEDDVPF